MDSLWSMSTTVREAKRVKGFLKVAKKMEGLEWTHENQAKFQVMLVQYHEYLNDPSNGQTFQKLDVDQCKWLMKIEEIIPYDIAESIIIAKNYTGGPEMRGRQSMSPLIKLGLVYKDKDNIIRISDVGNKYINDEITDEEFFIDSLVKLQYPNPIDESYSTRNIKPFIAILQLIKKVNELCKLKGMKEKGISKDEFGIFALSILDYRKIDEYAQLIVDYRIKYESIHNNADKKEFKESYILSFLSNYYKPLNNYDEYADNMIRYIRQTKLIYIRGKYENIYIDLEPRRIVEINMLLSSDDAKPLIFSDMQSWIDYYSNYGTYDLPYETDELLREIISNINKDNSDNAGKYNISYNEIIPTGDKKNLKVLVTKAREERTRIQNVVLKQEYFDTSKIDETIDMLLAINNRDKSKLTFKPSLELEKWVNIALNIINDSILIKPNTKVGDDNEPINTAPPGVADIECYYNDFNMICEVTMLTSRDQWFNEGQPVMRHLRDFENKDVKVSYCLFVAPSIHQDTLNTFWYSTKYEYEGKKQNIIPLTIKQLNEVLLSVKKLHSIGEKMKSQVFMDLLKRCSNVSGLGNTNDWKNKISSELSIWATTV